MATRAIRVDADVKAELLRRRLPRENHSDVIRRVLEERDLERRLARVGLGMAEMSRLAELRGLHG